MSAWSLAERTVPAPAPAARSLGRAALRAFEMQLKLRVANPLSYFQVVAQPLIFGVIGMILYAAGGRSNHLIYAVLGGGLVGLWSVTLFNAGYDINSERWTGTLEEIFGCPTPLSVIVLGKVGSSMLLGLVSFALNLAAAFLVFHHALNGIAPFAFSVSCLLALFTFFSMSLLIAPLFAWSRVSGSMANGLEVPAYLLCGFMFPATLLAGWVQPISWLLAPTWAVRAMYAAAGQGSGAPAYGLWWLLAVCLSLAYLGVGLLLFRVVENRARISGQLGIV